MKKILFIIFFILSSFLSMAVYNGQHDTNRDTIYIKDGKISGEIIDIKQNKIIIKNNNQNTIIIPLYKIERIYFSKRFVPTILLNQTIKYNNHTLKGRILYFDIVKSDILFLDGTQNQVIRIPIMETSLADKNLKQLYSSSSFLAIFLSLGIIAEILTKIFTPIVIYLSATFILLIFTLSLYWIFFKPWIQHKQYIKK